MEAEGAAAVPWSLVLALPVSRPTTGIRFGSHQLSASWSFLLLFTPSLFTTRNRARISVGAGVKVGA